MHSLKHSRAPKSLAAALVFILASGCYTYRPVTTPRVSERVRLTLTGQGTEELARFLGPRVVVAEGDLAAMRNDSMVVAVDFVQMTDGVRQPWSGEGVVTFPAAYVREVRERTFLRRQSYVAGTALTGGLIAAAIFALRGGGAEGGGGGGPPPPPP
jgi:hypothetical protein